MALLLLCMLMFAANFQNVYVSGASSIPNRYSLKDMSSDIVDRLVDAIKQLLDRVVELLKQLLDELKPLLTGVVKLVNNLLSGVSNALGNLNNLLGRLSDAGGLLSGLLGGRSKYSKESTEQVQQLLAECKEINSMLDQVEQECKNKGVYDQVKGSIDRTKGQLGTATSRISSLLNGQ